VPTEGVETTLWARFLPNGIEASRRIDDLKAARRYKQGELFVGRSHGAWTVIVSMIDLKITNRIEF